jgi:hypothetical protein
MAFLSEYDGTKPDILTYQPYKQTIETISALLLLYPIIVEEWVTEGVTIYFYQKSFWGKKQKGYLKLEYLTGKHSTEISPYKEADNTLPAYSDLLIGIAFGSVYTSVNWPQQHRNLTISSPPKQVLSYGIMIENIRFAQEVIGKMELEILAAGGGSIWDVSVMAKLDYQKRERDLLTQVANLFKVFEKFHSKSDYQSKGNE